MDQSRQDGANPAQRPNQQSPRDPLPEALPRGPLPRSANWSGVLAEQGYVVGVVISGPGERVALSDLNGNISARDAFLRPAGVTHSPSEVLGRVTGMVRGLLDGAGVRDREILRIAVGFGGPVDTRTGVIKESYSSAGWAGFPLAASLEKAFDAPIVVDNDARLAALGEVWFGAGQGVSPCSLVYLHWSAGVGGGLVIDGKLLRGCDGLAGEIGHTTVRTGPDALPCRCGGRGHLEPYIRADALVARARAAYEASGLPAPEGLNVQGIFDRSGTDPVLRALVDEATEMIAFTLGNLVTVHNPALVVLGGRVARVCGDCIQGIADQALAYSMPLTARSVKILPAALGEDSGVLGAVALGLESLQ